MTKKPLPLLWLIARFMFVSIGHPGIFVFLVYITEFMGFGVLQDMPGNNFKLNLPIFIILALVLYAFWLIAQSQVLKHIIKSFSPEKFLRHKLHIGPCMVSACGMLAIHALADGIEKNVGGWLFIFVVLPLCLFSFIIFLGNIFTHSSED